MGQSRAKGVPVVLMSAGAARSAVMEAIELGAVDFLDKPVSLHKLRNIWQHVVRKVPSSSTCTYGSFVALTFPCRCRCASCSCSPPPRGTKLLAILRHSTKSYARTTPRPLGHRAFFLVHDCSLKDSVGTS